MNTGRGGAGARSDDVNEAGLTARLLAAVAEVARELHPSRGAPEPALDDRLDGDLGFDSLGRVELVSRLEQTFDVVLPEGLAVTAETPRDLLAAVRGAPAAGVSRVAAAPRREPAARPAGRPAVPAAAQTWHDVLEWHAERRPDAVHLRFWRDDGDGETLTYGALLAGARRAAAGLLRLGVAPGDSVAIMLPTGRHYFLTFFGALLAGAVPVPLYPPFRPNRFEEHLRRQAGILDNSLTAALVTSEALLPVARLVAGQVRSLRAVVSPERLEQAEALPIRSTRTASDLALLQYTSGSTGAPKGVMLSHANLLANVRAMGTAVGVGPEDVMVSWLPLYHDMGLIGAWLGSLYYGLPLVLMSPLDFVARPARWLRAVHRYGGTLTAAPNFAFELCLRRVDDDAMRGVDLGSLRSVYNGAEPVSPDTMEGFVRRFAKYGFRRSAMMPVYGLAECSVGLAFPPPGRGPLVDRVRRRPLVLSGRAEPAGEEEADAMRFVACGRPLPGHEIRVVDAAGRELPERREGRIQFRGPSTTSGYFRNAEATAALFRDGWLDSGDLGYLVAGEVYVTGRAKDIVIRAGRNIYPQELEEAASRLPGVANVAVFGSADPRDGTERLVVVAETRRGDAAERRGIERAVAGLAVDLTGLPPDHVVLVPPGTIPRTSSGKVRRAACRRMFEEGALGRRARPVWRQLAALRLATVLPGLGRAWAAAGATAFAAYAWAVAGLVAPVGWLAVVALPRPGWRWAALGGVLRAAARLTGIAITVKGREAIPDGPAVLVSNHASYLDGFILAAALGRPVAFVVKAELLANPVAALPLKRIGAAFVERQERSKGVADARALAAEAARGRTLVYFPEGTFTRMPGLLPFHMGAFLAAAEAGVPLVPIALRGSRSILRAHSWFPRRGPVSVVIGEPLRPPAGADTWEKALWLREQARDHILRHGGEPDLGLERATIPTA